MVRRPDSQAAPSDDLARLDRIYLSICRSLAISTSATPARICRPARLLKPARRATCGTTRTSATFRRSRPRASPPKPKRARRTRLWATPTLRSSRWPSRHRRMPRSLTSLRRASPHTSNWLETTLETTATVDAPALRRVRQCTTIPSPPIRAGPKCSAEPTNARKPPRWPRGRGTRWRWTGCRPSRTEDGQGLSGRGNALWWRTRRGRSEGRGRRAESRPMMRG